MSPWNRRRLLRRSGAALSLAVAGCSGDREPDRTASPSATPTTAPPESTTRTSTTSESTTGEPTTSEPTTAPLPPAETLYRFGEWHVDDSWKLTVAEIELATAFRTDDGETYEMPAGEQLLVVTTRVGNVGSTRRGYSGRLDGVIDDRLYEDDIGFAHPDFEHGVGLDRLVQVEHVARYRPEAYQVDPDEIVTSWLAWTVPRSVRRADVQIGNDPENDWTYPVRWEPA